VRVITSPATVTGHASAGGGFPADVEISAFFDLVTDRGQKLR
jgi:hypothetical protein